MEGQQINFDFIIKMCLRKKKVANIVVCDTVFVLGILATVFKARYEGGFLTCLREMTVDGTLFASLVACVFSIMNHFEIQQDREVNSIPLYYLRLSSAVTEFIILLVVLIGYLPFVPDHPVINRFDMVNMHVIIPLLTLVSFVFHDAPIGKLSPLERFNGLIFIVLYSVAIMTCIATGIIAKNKIPYSFMNYYDNSIWYTLFAVVIIYLLGYLLSWMFSELNRKASWLWLKDIVKKA